MDGLFLPGRYTAFYNDKKMVKILHRELERKDEKLKHMKLEIMRPKTKNYYGGLEGTSTSFFLRDFFFLSATSIFHPRLLFLSATSFFYPRLLFFIHNFFFYLRLPFFYPRFFFSSATSFFSVLRVIRLRAHLH